MTTYRIGVIGLGQRIAHVLAAMKDVGWSFVLEAYADPAPVGAPILEAAEIRMGRQYADPAELIARGPYDLLMLGAPNHLHFEHLMLALQTGWPIFAEKPIVRTEEETEALEERQVVDCAPMWARYDAALSGAQQGRAEEVL